MLRKDTPILNYADDLLSRDIFVDSLASSIKNYVDKESLTIGLYGKWGEGKTSVINLVKEKLEEQTDIIYFRFEPWLYSNTEQLMSMFFKDLSYCIGNIYNQNELSKIFNSYAEAFEALSNLPEPTGMLKFLSKLLSFIFKKLSCQKTLLQLKVDIENYIESLNKKILIVIDDIDRLNNNEIQQIFQLVKMLGNFKNTIYLLSMDDEIIANSLKEVQKYDGYIYLEKIVQVPLRLPLSKKEDIFNYLYKNLQEILKDFLKYEDEKKYFDSLIDYDFSIFFDNLRDVNRYLNIFRFKKNALLNKVNKTDLAVLTAFEVFEADLFYWIKNNKDKLYQYNKDFTEAIKLFKNSNKEYLEKLLYRLFPKKQEQPIDIERIIKNKDYFEAYFCFTIDNRIYNKDLDIFLENIKTKEQLIEEVNYDLAYKNGQNIGKLLEQILLHPKTALIDEKKLLIVNAFMHIGDNILKYFNLKNYGIDVSKNLYILIKTFLNDLSLDSKDKKYEIILNSFDDTSDSLYIDVRFIDELLDIYSKQEPYNMISMFDLNISKDKEDILKSKLKNKINLFYINDKLLDVSYLSYVLNIWKILDKEKYTIFIEEIKQNDEKLLRFVKGFVYLNFDESINGIKKIDKEIIIKHIDFEIIENSDIFNKVSKYFR
ncbi:KAP family NTPase [Aliarcobacter cryaerophilus]|uniref:KAP family NTPase n=1 Tax=Aliarcobacter cryaerophilus TaxID=28198 RepID=A0AA46NFK9_9BACT|nr:KAP family NTPase [Aliarcobacter cryaerophilus]UYF42492.1 KAP family NTPase [Aliarcobacter cryaerophilus]